MDNRTQEYIEKVGKQTLDKDLNYIQNELICKYIDEKGEWVYMKYSRTLGAIAILSITKDQYIKYWQSRYKSTDSQCLKSITLACTDLFNNKLISTEQMLKLVQNSNDITKDKPQAINMLSKTIRYLDKINM